jgi:DHA3 family macrolide efflux protein-like MFS transporter
MAEFTKILKKRNFFLLWLGQIISQLGDRLDQMALIGFVYLRAPGSTMGIAKILSFTILPVFLIGPLAGVYVDRWDRRRTMYISDILRSVLVLIIPLCLFYSRSLIPIYLIIFIVFSIGRFFVPAKLSVIPELVDKKDLLIANSLVNTTGMIAAILGFGISGLVVEWLGPKSGFYLDSLSFLISAVLIFLIRKKASGTVKLAKVSREIVEVIRKSAFQELKEGILYFLRQKHIRFTASIIFALWSALGAIYVVLIVFVQKTLHSATKDLGLLIMFLGIGLFLGSLVYGRFGQRISHYKVIFASLVLSGIMLIIFALTIERYPYFSAAAGVSLCLGLVVAPIMIATNTIIHRVSDSSMMGKTFSSLEIVMHLGFLLFMLISSLLAERISHLSILVIVGCVFSILGVINLIYHRRIPWLD